MTFINPIMLAGLVCGLIPLVLHLLNRSRYRNIEWGAMMFLNGLEPRQFHSTRLKQWALLALRSAILALLAVGLARPVIHARGIPPAAIGRTAAVLLLDRSASMSLNDNGRVRLDLAREAIFQLLSPGFRRGDDLWLRTLGDENSSTAMRYAGDPQEMARIVKEVTVPTGEADVVAGLSEAIEVLARAEAPNREIYLFCDRQAVSWRGVDETFLRDWRERLARLPQTPRLFVVPVGSDEADNVAVEAIDIVRPPMVADQPSDISIRLRNRSRVPRAAIPLTVEVRSAGGTRMVRQIPVNLPAEGATIITVPVTVTPNEAGSNIITARITAPGPAADKELHYSVDVLKDLKVLLVEGDEGEGAFQGGADFLKLAIAPLPGTRRNSGKPIVLRPDAWGPADIRECSVLILANVPAVTEAQAETIQRFVYGGGGLIVAPGDQTRVDNYNVQLPWLPAVLQPPTAESAGGATTVGTLELTHPIFGFLVGRPDASPAVVRRYFPATPTAGSRVLGSYADGKPFLIEGDVGRGRVLLMTTPADPDWTTLPLTHIFLPFAQSAVRYAAAGPSVERAARRNVTVGQPIVANFDDVIDLKNISATGPLGKIDATKLAVSQFGYHTQVRYAGASSPGIYRVSARNATEMRTIQFVVRTPLEESDLTAISDERWRWLEKELNVKRIDPAGRTLAAAQESVRSGIELWLPLLGAVIVLSMVELSATRRWAGGTS